MATNNAVNTTLSGQTGTGNFVGATSPTLITPILGVAAATSVNFGGTALSTYIKNGAWTPVVTFVTPGDLSVSYSTQTGVYSQIGNICNVHFQLVFTPTYTTASGNLTITGAPVTAVNNILGAAASSLVTFAAGKTAIAATMIGGASTISIYQYGSGLAINFLSTTNLATGVQYLIYGTIPVLTS